jgi:hypothetical protein
MELRRPLWIFLVGVLLFVSSISGAGEAETMSGADVMSYVTIKDLKDPTWGDATPEPEVSDEDYFEYSSKNFDDSQVAVWYSLWTVLRQNETNWKELGEWRLFANDWYNTKNFECSLSMQHCLGEKKLESLQADYPGIKNRPLVRRIYFVSRAYRTFHNYGRAVQVSVMASHNSPFLIMSRHPLKELKPIWSLWFPSLSVLLLSKAHNAERGCVPL